MHLPWFGDWSVRSAVHFWLLMAWVVFWSAILYDLLLFWGWAFWIMSLPSPGLLCIHFVALLAFPTISLCYFCCNVVWLNPARPLWTCCLFPSQWLSAFTGPFLTLFAGSCVPFPSWASLAYLFSFNFLGPFSILLSHGPLLTLLGFSNPITLYLILGIDGSSISPLLSLLALLWAYYGPFLLFYILPIGFFSISRPISTCLLPQDPLYKPVSHSFLPLGLNGFFLLANFGLPMLLGFFSYWACQNEPQHLPIVFK